jgi:hypothetical protein
MTYEEREAAFVVALTALTKQYGVAIGGCGCCGSPWTSDTDATHSSGRNGHYTNVEQLEWDIPQ